MNPTPVTTRNSAPLPKGADSTEDGKAFTGLRLSFQIIVTPYAGTPTQAKTNGVIRNKTDRVID